MRASELNIRMTLTCLIINHTTVGNPPHPFGEPQAIHSVFSTYFFSDFERENIELKRTLSEQQLSLHKLDFEKKLLKKERDDLENLLSDAESKLDAAEKLKRRLENFLTQNFESVNELKNSLRAALSEESPVDENHQSLTFNE